MFFFALQTLFDSSWESNNGFERAAPGVVFESLGT